MNKDETIKKMAEAIAKVEGYTSKASIKFYIEAAQAAYSIVENDSLIKDDLIKLQSEISRLKAIEVNYCNSEDSSYQDCKDFFDAMDVIDQLNKLIAEQGKQDIWVDEDNAMAQQWGKP